MFGVVSLCSNKKNVFSCSPYANALFPYSTAEIRVIENEGSLNVSVRIMALNISNVTEPNSQRNTARRTEKRPKAFSIGVHMFMLAFMW